MSRYHNNARLAGKMAGIKDESAALRRATRGDMVPEKLRIDYDALAEVDAFLEGLGVWKSSKFAIVKTHGAKSLAMIRTDPWLLSREVKGIGFAMADRIAERVGADMKSTTRVRAGIMHVIRETCWQGGHTRLPLPTVIEEATRLLGLGPAVIEKEIEVLIKSGALADAAGFLAPPSLATDEAMVAGKLLTLLKADLPSGSPVLDGLAEDQIAAVKGACESPVFILTGAPGTGKTYTIKRIIEAFPDADIALAAPTGKAAKRMIEHTGMDAQTIHRLLEPSFDRDTGGFSFGRTASHPLDLDLIILDEVSMIDVSLMARLLEAVRPGTRLILVGDTYQLPAVGPGNVLKDLIASGVVPSVELTIIKRQDDVGGLIVKNCHRIKEGKDIELANREGSDFFFMNISDPEKIQSTIYDLVSKRLPEKYGADPLKDIQLISPLREKTTLSCKAFNELFQSRFNSALPVPKCRYKVGDKVINTRNDYKAGIINGDIGYVVFINPSMKTITVNFEAPDREVTLPLYDNALDLAYCVTCHKYQGSEARIVVVPIHRSFGGLIMQRNWLYTAISRAREVCVLVGQRSEVPLIIGRNQQQRRETALRGLMEGERS
ncbi:MAG: AAA family ATPase [Patescibacteria group bacterium]